MSPATNGKSTPTSGVKRRAPSTASSSKKRAKQGSVMKSKTSKANGDAPEEIKSKPDGWDSMNLYKSFLLSNERFELHDTIFVNSQEQPDDAAKEEDEEVPQKTIDETDTTLWVAAVVEVRAQNAWNVWVRIEWFYRPDELPGGRQPYHGKREVVKSPVQDIISAHTVAGHADVTHWEEMDDTKDADGIDGLFWRQTFDPYSGKLGDVRLHCICKKPYNPDTTMFWCDKCKIWEHEKCLIDAIKKDYIKSNLSSVGGKKGRKSFGKNIDITIAANESTGEVTAYIDDKDQKVKSEGEDGTEPNDEQKVKVKTAEAGLKTSIPVKCLKCGAQLK